MATKLGGGFVAKVAKIPKFSDFVKDLYLRKNFAASRQNGDKTRGGCCEGGGLLRGIAVMVATRGVFSPGGGGTEVPHLGEPPKIFERSPDSCVSARKTLFERNLYVAHLRALAIESQVTVTARTRAHENPKCYSALYETAARSAAKICYRALCEMTSSYM